MLTSILIIMIICNSSNSDNDSNNDNNVHNNNHNNDNNNNDNNDDDNNNNNREFGNSPRFRSQNIGPSGEPQSSLQALLSSMFLLLSLCFLSYFFGIF